MKLNNVIILNIYQLRRFFVFAEFWAKREEFILWMGGSDIFKSREQEDIFFGPHRHDSYYLYIKLVKPWLNGELSVVPDGVRLENERIIVDNRNIKRACTMGCNQQLKHFNEGDRLGVVALYEMINRLLKNDLIDVMSLLGVDYYDFNADFIGIRDGQEVELPSLQSTIELPCGEDTPLRNVLIANVSDQGVQGAVAKLGDRQVRLGTGECCRALFWGEHCVSMLLHDNVDMVVEYYTASKTTSGAKVKNKDECYENVIDMLCGKGDRFMLLTNGKKRIISTLQQFDQADMNDSLPQDELPVHIALSENEIELLMLCANKNLYRFTKNSDRWEPVSSDVLMVRCEGGETKVTHTNDITTQ